MPAPITDARLALLKLLNIPAGTLTAWLSGEAQPPDYVRVHPEVIASFRKQTGEGPRRLPAD
jgi:hypothetical protein